MTERDPNEKTGAGRDVPADPAHHQAETVEALEERISTDRPDPTDDVEQVAGEDVTEPTRDGADDEDPSATESSG
jgi:hypothetical protein